MKPEKFICPVRSRCKGAPDCPHAVPHEEMFECRDGGEKSRCPSCVSWTPPERAKILVWEDELERTLLCLYNRLTLPRYLTADDFVREEKNNLTGKV